MIPHAVIITNSAVYVQWNKRGPFMVLHEDGTVGEQFRMPPGGHYVEPGSIGPVPGGVLPGMGRAAG